MKKRMTILALLLAGAVTLGSYGMVQAGQEKREVPVAGVTQTLAQVLKEAGGVQAQTADAVEELQSNAAVARMMEPEMVAEEAWETAEIAENELPQTASEFADIAVAQVNHYVNVRQEPDTESEILGKLYDKSAATVLETTEDGWYRITSGNVNGYVKAEYVVVGDEELARSVGTRLATVTTTTLFVRTEPTTEAKVLTMLPDGDDVVVTDESTEGWAKVSTADGDGYVALDYAAFGINLPRTSSEQRSVGYAVSLSEIQPGDIVCYSGHVGIYAGNNTLIHASNEKTGITLTSPVTYRSVLAVRRIF